MVLFLEESAEDKPKRKKKEPLKIDFEANTDVPEKSFKVDTDTGELSFSF